MRWGLELVIAHRTMASSHIPPEDLKACFQGVGGGYIQLRWKSRHRPFYSASSPTARKHSLLFGGAYAPNDAIYRKRYAFATIIMPPTYFLRARRQKQLLTVLCLAYPPLRPKNSWKQAILTCFRLFLVDHMFAWFLAFFGFSIAFS